MKRTAISKKRSAGLVFLGLLFLLFLPSTGWSKTTRVAVLPWKVNSAENMDFVKNAMLDMLSSRIGSNKDIEVIRPDEVRSALPGTAEITDKAATEVGRKLKADYVLYGSLTVFGNAVSLDARLLKTADGTASPLYSKATGLDSVVGLADKLSNDVLIATGVLAPPSAPLVPPTAEGVEMKKTVTPPTEEKKPAEGNGFIVKPEAARTPASWKSEKMDGMYVSMVAADLDRDGVKEIILLRKRSLRIARLKDNGLETVKEIKAEGGADFIDVSALDTDGDGTPEIFVSAVKNNKPYGSVIEFKNKNFSVTVTGVKWMMRTVRVGNSDPVLVGAQFRRADGFYGELQVLKKEGAEVVAKGPFEIRLPSKVDLFRFGAFDATNSGASSLVALDSREYLNIYKKDDKGGWDKDWTSSEYYGGTLNYIEFQDESASNGKPPVPVESRFYNTTTKDGKTELIIKRNVPGGLGRRAEMAGSFVSGEVISLSWDGALLSENWKTKEVPGYIADFFIEDLRGDGTRDIVMLVVEGTEKLTGTPKSYVLSYRLTI